MWSVGWKDRIENDSKTINTMEMHIGTKLIVGSVALLLLNGCSTLRDSLILGTGTGLVAGGVVGNQMPGDKGENAIKGAVLGGAFAALATYIVHGSLEKRDSGVRRDTLMNLERYEVLGIDGMRINSTETRKGRCFTTQEVDGRLASIPCELVGSSESNY